MTHIPVLLEPILQAARDLNAPPQRYFDGTFGRGGHARAIMNEFGDLKVIACDQDHEAVAFAKSEFAGEIETGKLKIFHANFRDFAALKESHAEFQTGFDLILLDLGVSSPQLDQAERGFSFYHDGPLDMRMDQRLERTAADLINEESEDELVRIFREYGEVRRPFRVVRALVHDRKEKTFSSTADVAGLIERVDGWQRKGMHPATQYFMALRLAVNFELEAVSEAIAPLVHALNDGGRLMVISFHSLEDRIVKKALRAFEPDTGFRINKKVIEASEDEAKANPRSRSAKLRIFQKGAKYDRERIF